MKENEQTVAEVFLSRVSALFVDKNNWHFGNNLPGLLPKKAKKSSKK